MGSPPAGRRRTRHLPRKPTSQIEISTTGAGLASHPIHSTGCAEPRGTLNGLNQAGPACWLLPRQACEAGADQARRSRARNRLGTGLPPLRPPRRAGLSVTDRRRSRQLFHEQGWPAVNHPCRIELRIDDHRLLSGRKPLEVLEADPEGESSYAPQIEVAPVRALVASDDVTDGPGGLGQHLTHRTPGGMRSGALWGHPRSPEASAPVRSSRVQSAPDPGRSPAPAGGEPVTSSSAGMSGLVFGRVDRRTRRTGRGAPVEGRQPHWGRRWAGGRVRRRAGARGQWLVVPRRDCSRGVSSRSAAVPVAKE